MVLADKVGGRKLLHENAISEKTKLVYSQRTNGAIEIQCNFPVGISLENYGHDLTLSALQGLVFVNIFQETGN